MEVRELAVYGQFPDERVYVDDVFTFGDTSPRSLCFLSLTKAGGIPNQARSSQQLSKRSQHLKRMPHVLDFLSNLLNLIGLQVP
jgi:hypothetical protein